MFDLVYQKTFMWKEQSNWFSFFKLFNVAYSKADGPGVQNLDSW